MVHDYHYTTVLPCATICFTCIALESLKVDVYNIVNITTAINYVNYCLDNYIRNVLVYVHHHYLIQTRNLNYLFQQSNTQYHSHSYFSGTIRIWNSIPGIVPLSRAYTH